MLSQVGPLIGFSQMVTNGNPQICALVNSTTNIVENMIMADPSIDPAPNGYFLIPIPSGTSVGVGWIYDPATGTFTDPNPPPPPPPDENPAP